MSLAQSVVAIAARPGVQARAPRPPGALRPVHWAMLAPVLLLTAGLLAVPALQVGWLSLNASTYGADTRFVGLANYAALFNDRIFWRAFLNTVVVVNAIVYGELLLGLGLAVLMTGWVPCKRLVIAVLIAPYAISEASGIVMWRYMVEPDVGLVTQLLARAGLGGFDWSTSPVLTLSLAAVIAIWHHLPFTFLILYAALTTVPRELLEAAEIDGASPWQRFTRVTLRLIMPALLLCALFRTIYAIRLFSEVWLLSEGGPARLSEVLGIYLYRETFKYHDFGVASATGWCMLVLSMVVAAPYLWRMHKAATRDA